MRSRRRATSSRWRTWKRCGGRCEADTVAATGVMTNYDDIPIGGKLQNVKVNGTDQDYQRVRNMVDQLGPFSGRERRGGPREGGAADRSPGRAAVRHARRGGRPLHPAVRAAVHGDRDVSRAGGDVRAIGGGARHDRDSHHGAAVFHAGGADRPDVRAGAVGGDGGADGGAGGGTAGEPAPSGRAVPGGHADGHPGGGQEHLADPVAGADSGFGDHAADLGDRHHEHHAGDGDGADAGNRRAAGGRGVGRRRSCCNFWPRR